MFKKIKKFTEIDITKASSDELVLLIEVAGTELRKRFDQSAVVKAEPKPKVTAIVPTEREKNFIRNCLRKEYVHADMKNQYRDIAKKYLEWFEVNELPQDLRGGEYKRYRAYYG
ncbi:hypothetical protein [Photorhabdus luminescens]|uniref:hypothetical protein n=1 Tax=Photorhabdus luminescens TaxID=29488 RepID=UPI00223F9DCA|nr:hypothetical protein [Photorhabdus luminescens]MCW7763398.1 hypothetical protein [Photorhabdus luminescens subsp. venezuelensis]